MNPALNPEQLRTLILEIIGEVAPEADLAGIDPSFSFHDQFGIDSVDYLTIMMRIEEKLGVVIPESDYPKLSSLEGCMRYLAPELSGSEQQAPAESR